MKKIFSIILVVIVFFAVGCSSTVIVSYMRPSNVNMGSYRNIAIASTVPYRGGNLVYPSRVRCIDSYTSWIYLTPSYNYTLPSNVADYATSKLVSTLSNTGYFNILSPELTDQYLSARSIGYNPSKLLLEKGYDAVMIPKIENMNVDEYIWGVIESYEEDANGKKWPQYEYYIKRRVNITYSITVVDCKTDKVISKKIFENSRDWEDSFDPSFPVFSSDVYYLYRSLINEFSSLILKQYVPSLVEENVSLMSNKPKLESVKEAYKAVDNGSIEYAYDIFLQYWNEQGHIPSGYNAALLQSAMGDYDGAIALLENIRKKVQNSDIEYLYKDLKAKKSSTEAAKAQIEGAGETLDVGNIEYSLYDYLLN